MVNLPGSDRNMYIAVCDDMSKELDNIKNLLSVWQEKHNISVHCKYFRNAEELIASAKKEHFTLYLLDIIMPGTNGMSAAKEIRSFDKTADIVFLTSSPGFAYESYRVKALEYLLKPVSADMLYQLLDRIYIKERKPNDAFAVKTGSVIVRIPFSQLAYVEVNGKHLYFNLADGQVKEVFGSLKEYEGLLLSRDEFTRIHRSYIVNMQYIEELSPSGILMFTGKNLPVSRLIYPQLQKDYMNLLFSVREV